MKRKFSILVCAALTIAAALPAEAGDVLDGIVATVNGRIILQSDWDEAIRYAALVDGRPLEQLSLPDRKAALDRLIDQELLEEQMRSSELKHASDQEVTQAVQEIRNRYLNGNNDQGWRDVLARYGLTEEEVRQRAALQSDLNRLVDVRLRPGVDIDARSIESYYDQELLPQLRQTGAKQVPLAEVTPTIKKLLTEKKVNQLLVAWLQNLRSGSEIQTEDSASDSRDSSR